MEPPPKSISRRNGHGETVPKAQYEELKAKYDSNLKLLENTTKEMERYAIQLGKARVKLRDCKDTIKGWQEWYDRHPKYVNNEPNDFRVKISGARPCEPLHSSDSVTSKRQKMPLESQPWPDELPDGDSDTLPTEEVAAPPPDQTESTPTSKAHRNASSQTTQDDREFSNEDEQRLDSRLQDADDDPVFISTRTVKHNRPISAPAADTVSTKRGEGTPQAPFKIKEEETESPILYRQSQRQLGRMQTSDLDTMLGEIETPRKRRKIHNLNDEMLRHYHKNKSFQPEPERGHEHVRPIRQLPPENESPSGENISPRQEEVEEPVPPAAPRTLPWETRTRLKSPVRSYPRAERQVSGPLQEINPNTPTLPRTSKYSPKSSKSFKSARRSDGSRGSNAISMISEDKAAPHETHKERPQRIDRLENLLEGHQFPAPSVDLTPQAPSTVVRKRKTEATKSKPSPQEPQTVRRVNGRTASPAISTSTASTTRHRPQSPTHSEIDPDHEPLRSRPLHRLNLNDFKINPAYAGTTYAYTSPSRTKASRACLPGCTRPCCSALRAFMPTTTPSTSTTLTAADDELLRNHLGHSYHQVAPTLSLQQKLDMVTEAKAQAFANKYGRHRQVFERRTTPPGFWNGDMETSQEREMHREEARLQVREEVERRWRSALGEGGRFQFRDE